MFNAVRRIGVFQRHLTYTSVTLCRSNTTAVNLTVSPTTCLIDEKTHIRVNGLATHQEVTLTSSIEESGKKWEARAVFRANKDGQIDSRYDPSIAGSFTDVDQMGLFWSLKPEAGQKPGLYLIKKDVTTPLDFTIRVYDGAHAGDTKIRQTPLTTAVVHRLYKSPSVRRIPVTEGPYRGTIFIPEGDGPFPGLIDANGAMVSLIESRAALLASHGYATFALAYLYQDHLPKTLLAADPIYFKNAVDWFSQQDCVDENRLGAVCHCYGGMMASITAALLPKLRVVVNINGLSIMPCALEETVQTDYGKIPRKDGSGKQWPNPDLMFVTDEGLEIKDVFDCDPAVCIPAWRHGAKLLLFAAEDDIQVNPKWHKYCVDHWPEQYRANVELVQYPGAGHLIDPPYSPLCRAANPGPARMSQLDFMKEEYKGQLLMCGGFPKQHAYAQVDIWHRTLKFLQKHL